MENCGHKLQTSLCWGRLHNMTHYNQNKGQSNLRTLSMDDSNLLFHSQSKLKTLNPRRSENPLIRQVKPRACNWYEVTGEQLRFSLIVSKGPEECLFPHNARTLETNLIECLLCVIIYDLKSVSWKSGGDIWKWGVFDADQRRAALSD